ncbi:MAG: hypothetical protein ACYC26_06520 [Phycisphaerales bacterium]
MTDPLEQLSDASQQQVGVPSRPARRPRPDRVEQQYAKYMPRLGYVVLIAIPLAVGCIWWAMSIGSGALMVGGLVLLLIGIAAGTAYKWLGRARSAGRRLAARQLAALGGSEKDLEPIPRRRSAMMMSDDAESP